MIAVDRASVEVAEPASGKVRHYMGSCKCGYRASFAAVVANFRVDADTAARLAAVFNDPPAGVRRTFAMGTFRPTSKTWGGYVTERIAIPIASGYGVCGCGRWIKYAPIKASYHPDVKCGGVCRNAKGTTCDCSCNGANHGQGFRVG